MEAGNGKCKANNKDKEEAGVKMKACEEKGKEGMEDSKNDPTMENQSPCSVVRAEVMKRAKEAEWDAKGAVVDAKRAVVDAEQVAKWAAVDEERVAFRVKQAVECGEWAVDDLEWAENYVERKKGWAQKQEAEGKMCPSRLLLGYFKLDFTLMDAECEAMDAKWAAEEAKRAAGHAKRAVEDAQRVVEDAKRAVEDREQAAAEVKLQAAKAKHVEDPTWVRKRAKEWLEKWVEDGKKWKAEYEKREAEYEKRDAVYKKQEEEFEKQKAEYNKLEKGKLKHMMQWKIDDLNEAMKRDVGFRKAMERKKRSATKRKEAKITEARNRVAKVAAKMARNDELLAVWGEARVIFMGQQAEVIDALRQKEI